MSSEEATVAEVDGVVGGLDVVTEEESNEGGVDGDDSNAEGEPDVPDDEDDEISEGVALLNVHLYLKFFLEINY